jgi:hypothetical protein
MTDQSKFKTGNVCDKHPELAGQRYRCSSSCVRCAKERAAKQYEENREAIVARRAAWEAARYAANPEKARAKKNAWYAANNKKNRLWCANRRAAKMERTVPFSDLDMIARIYDFAALCDGVHVDHIVPLRGKLVSGLHVSWNLRVISAEENVRKRDSFDPITHVHQLP